jgi:endogenous inhibitor of DNA gyrase (YacG/DUF329 family)
MPGMQKVGDWFTPFGPFCSKRCKLVDLGKWFAENTPLPNRFVPIIERYDEPPPGERLINPKSGDNVCPC